MVLDSLFDDQEDGVQRSMIRARLIVIEDCRSQSGLPILVHLIHRSLDAANEHRNKNSIEPQHRVLLINTNSDLSRSLHHRLAGVVSSSCFLSIDPNEPVDSVNHPTDPPTNPLESVIQRARQFIDRAMTTVEPSESPTLSIVIDSVQELDRSFSIHQTFNFLRSLLDLLPNSRSRLIVLHSPYLQPYQPDSVFGSSIACGSSLSTSLLHLKIHPTCLLNRIINQFGIPIPVQSSQPIGTYYDIRLFPLIDELADQADPYLISTPTDRGEDDDQPIPQALLIPSNPSIPHLGSCVIEWTAKNLPTCQSRPSNSIPSKSTDPKSRAGRSTNMTSVQHGLEGLQLSVAGSKSSIADYGLIPVPISKLLHKKSFKLSTELDRSCWSNQVDPLESTAQLTFNLSLTDKQRADREAVQLPFLPKRSEDGSVIEAPGEIYDGSFQNPDSIKNRNRGGMILYEPDSADDMDDEEPDDDF